METSFLFPSPCSLKTLHYTYNIYLFLAASQRKKKSSFKNTPPCELDYVVIRSGSTPGLLAFWDKMTRFWMVCRLGVGSGPPGDYDTAQVSLPPLNFMVTRKKPVHRVGFVRLWNTRSPGSCCSWGHGTGQCGVVCNAGSGDTNPACHNWPGVGMEGCGGISTPPAFLRAASQGASYWCHASLQWCSSQDSCKAFLWPLSLLDHRLCCLVAILLCSFPANC